MSSKKSRMPSFARGTSGAWRWRLPIFSKSRSRTGPGTVPILIGVVFIYVDFLAPLEQLRAETERIVRASKRWDGRVFAFQVTDFKSDCVEIRILASDLNASVTFDLRCEIREQMLSFLQARYPEAFRRLRTLWSRSSSGRLPGTADGQPATCLFGPHTRKMLSTEKALTRHGDHLNRGSAGAAPIPQES